MSPVQIGIALGGAVLAVGAAAILRRRRPDAPTQPSYPVPTQLDRSDFPRPDVPWLVAVFSSATCSTCADVVSKAHVLASDDVAVCDIEYSRSRDLHARYGIESVPTLVIADAEGVVKKSFMGAVTATDLWAAVAECRAPGSGAVGGGGCR